VCGPLLQLAIGIGINVNMPQEALDQIVRPIWPASSLLVECKREFNVSGVIGALVASFGNNLRLFLHKGFPSFQARVNSILTLKGIRVKFNDDRETWEGVQEGINENGHLLLRLDSGEVKVFVSGEHVQSLQLAN